MKYKNLFLFVFIFLINTEILVYSDDVYGFIYIEYGQEFSTIPAKQTKQNFFQLAMALRNLIFPSIIMS